MSLANSWHFSRSITVSVYCRLNFQSQDFGLKVWGYCWGMHSWSNFLVHIQLKGCKKILSTAFNLAWFVCLKSKCSFSTLSLAVTPFQLVVIVLAIDTYSDCHWGSSCACHLARWCFAAGFVLLFHDATSCHLEYSNYCLLVYRLLTSIRLSSFGV